ncbi:MAG: polysaccharide pyruvyl transferase family protein [Acholeplasma sp.]|nr:polysaccharide pyruvyl transferase family protein [Acholeplasma sp.]
MNKYAILTFHDARNYGAVLQAFALQTVIKEKGYHSEFLRYYDKNYIGSSKRSHSLADIYKLLKNNNFNIYSYVRTYRIKNEVNKQFEIFRKAYMVLSENAYFTDDDLYKANIEYHGFICGSDMIWSDIGQNLDVFFLSFADSKKRISYAPSITGTDNLDETEHIKMKDRINGIRFLSCREQAGVDYIKKTADKSATLVLDPTFLLAKSDWVKYLSLEKYSSKKYILCYIFGGISKSFKIKLDKFAKKENLDIRFVPNSANEILSEVKNGYSGMYGPREYVELFFNAEYIVTNTFHGLAFSLIFEKNFVLLHKLKNSSMSSHEERLNNILKICNLTNRYYSENINFEDNFGQINYNMVTKLLNSHKVTSLNFLFNALEQVENNKEE